MQHQLEESCEQLEGKKLVAMLGNNCFKSIGENGNLFPRLTLMMSSEQREIEREMRR